MPLHQRQIIREAVKAAIVAANTSAAGRVYETRMTPWARALLPAIAVYTLSETIAPESVNTAPRRLERLMRLEIEAALEATADVDDALDALALQIERAMHADETFGAVCNRSVLASTDVEIGEIGNKPVGFLSLVYDVIYFTDAPDAADVVLGTLSTVDVKTDLGNAQPVGDQAEDLIQNLEI